MRCAIYARYSSDFQRETSIADQIRETKDFAARKPDWKILKQHNYHDSGISGQKFEERIGLVALLEAARLSPKPFDLVLVDDSSRLCREPEIFYRVKNELSFRGIGIYFCVQQLNSLDESAEFPMGIAAIQDKAFITQLRHKVRRGQRGAITRGNVPSGKVLGFTNEPVLDPSGKKGRYGMVNVLYSKYVVNKAEAKLVRRIFEMYADDPEMSQVDIARQLNQDKVPSPSGAWGKSALKGQGQWGHTTIQRILNNKKYIGVFEWGKTREFKHERYGRRVEKTPADEWTIYESNDLRIISQELWDRVHKKMALRAIQYERRRLGGLKRASYPLSGLLFCGKCGGSMSVFDTSSKSKFGYVKYGCSQHYYKGSCTNTAFLRSTHVFEDVITIVNDELLAPEFIAERKRELRKRIDNRLKASRSVSGKVERDRLTAEKQKLEREIERAADMVLSAEPNVRGVLMKKLNERQDRVEAITEELTTMRPFDAEALYRDTTSAIDAVVQELKSTVKRAEVLQKNGVADGSDDRELRSKLSRVVGKVIAHPTGKAWPDRTYEIAVEWKPFGSSQQIFATSL